MSKSSAYKNYVEAKSVVIPLGLIAFSDPLKPLPLKIGAFEELSDVVGEMTAKNFLHLWTSRREYTAMIALGGARHDLHGRECGEVSEEAMSLAATIISKPKKKREREAHPIRTEAQAQRRIRRLRKRLSYVDERRARNIRNQIDGWERRLSEGRLS